MSALYTCASVARLMQIKDVTEDDAKLIRKIWKSVKYRELAKLYPRVGEFDQADYSLGTLKMMCIDQVLHTCGVEFLGVRRKDYETVYYCNAGDMYADTAVFIGDRLVAGCLDGYVLLTNDELY